MEINELVEQSHSLAKQKGWHDTERSPLEIHMLIVSEIAEATEEARKGKIYPIYQWLSLPVTESEKEIGIKTSKEMISSIDDRWSYASKPEGEAIELADAVIRIADYFGMKGWNLEEALKIKMNYNKTRSYRHGGKKY